LQFESRYVLTIGVDFGVKPVKLASGEAVKVNFWDLSGKPEFLEVRNEFYRDAQAALLVFDVCKPDTLLALDNWLREAQRFGAASALPLVVCANKTDKGRRAVSAADAKDWCVSRGLPLVETSAESGEGVSEAVEQLVEQAAKLWRPR
jgi:DnaJ homolog subfamily C member 27